MDLKGRGGVVGSAVVGTSYGSSAVAFSEQLHAFHHKQQQLLMGAGSGDNDDEGGDSSERDAKGETEASSSDETLGRIQFSVSYDFQAGYITLIITCNILWIIIIKYVKLGLHNYTFLCEKVDGRLWNDNTQLNSLERALYG